MLREKPTGTIRTAYDLNNDPYLFEATGTEAKRFVDILKADDEGRLLILPSAEKTGKWILNDNGTFSCSLCQSWIPNEQHHYARYCLYCGAKMVNENE